MPRPSKPILSRRRIAPAALELVDEEGIGSVTTLDGLNRARVRE
jgi:hypothetical protein